MRVHSYIEYQWNPGTQRMELVRDDWEEYAGPVAQMKSGGGGGSTTTVQKSDPWGGVQPYLGELYRGASQYFNSPGPQYYPWDPVAGVNGNQYGGRQQQVDTLRHPDTQRRWLNAVNPTEQVATQDRNALAGNPVLQGIIGQSRGGSVGQLGVDYRGAINQVLSGRPDAGYIDPLIGAAANRLNHQFGQQVSDVARTLGEQVLPNIRSGAAGAGQYGSTRQGIAEGLALGRAGQELLREAGRGREQVGDLAANLYGGAISQAQQLQAGMAQNLAGLDEASRQARTREALSGLGLSEQGRELRTREALTAAGLLPGLATLPAQWGAQIEDIGNRQQADDQARINADIERWNFNQNSRLNQLSNYAALLQGAGSLGGTTSSTQPVYRNPIMGGLGGALSGFSLGSALGAPFGLALGPPAWIGAGLGLLGGLF